MFGWNSEEARQKCVNEVVESNLEWDRGAGEGDERIGQNYLIRIWRGYCLYAELPRYAKHRWGLRIESYGPWH